MILGLIPARGGSKAIPRKNLAILRGKTLLAWTAAAALAARRLDRVVLSTDDDEIAGAGERLGLEVLRRPAELGRDETPMLPVMRHAAAATGADIIVLLQPTSPLRRAEHIDGAVALLVDSGADTVVSVVEVPHQFSPVSVMRMAEDGTVTPFLPGPMILRRQDKPRVFARNGPAVLAVRRATLDADLLYGERVAGYLMSQDDSLDIDGPADLAAAERTLAHA